jgi:hypothetical protein
VEMTVQDRAGSRGPAKKPPGSRKADCRAEPNPGDQNTSTPVELRTSPL